MLKSVNKVPRFSFFKNSSHLETLYGSPSLPGKKNNKKKMPVKVGTRPDHLVFIISDSFHHFKVCFFKLLPSVFCINFYSWYFDLIFHVFDLKMSHLNFITQHKIKLNSVLEIVNLTELESDSCFYLSQFCFIIFSKSHL